MHCNMIGETLAYRSVFFVTSEGKQKDRLAAVFS